jgi:CheY-like chemotaxis protein
MPEMDGFEVRKHLRAALGGAERLLARGVVPAHADLRPIED